MLTITNQTPLVDLPQLPDIPTSPDPHTALVAWRSPYSALGLPIGVSGETYIRIVVGKLEIFH
jgi:hypothetical protein